MAEVASQLARDGRPVVFFARELRAGSPVAEMFSSSGASIYCGSWLLYCRLLRVYRPSATLAFGLRPSLVTRFLSLARKGAKLGIARNGLDYTWPKWYYLVDRLTSGFVDVYIANSQAVRTHLASYGIPANKIRVVPSALSEEWYSPLTCEPAREVPRIAIIGNARPEKNQRALLEELFRSGIQADLAIFTDDSSKLMPDVSEFEGNRGRVEVFENHVVKPDDLDRCDILLHPSLSESLPRVVLEATARGLFVIAYDVGDTRLVVNVGRSRILPLDPDCAAMVEALRDVLTKIGHIRSTRSVQLGSNIRAYSEQILRILEDPTAEDNVDV